MAAHGVHETGQAPANVLIWRLEGLVTCGPADLDIAYAMSAYGYDAIKWADGQIMLAQLANTDDPPETTVAAARAWYEAAASAAQQALRSRPQLLAKLGLAQVSPA